MEWVEKHVTTLITVIPVSNLGLRLAVVANSAIPILGHAMPKTELTTTASPNFSPSLRLQPSFGLIRSAEIVIMITKQINTVSLPLLPFVIEMVHYVLTGVIVTDLQK